jgi:hypothetical protein
MGAIDLLRLVGFAIAFLVAGSKTPKFVVDELTVFVLAAVALALFKVWKFGVLVVSSVDIALILTHVLPWGATGVAGFFSQFTTDLLFFLAALVSVFAYRRTSAVGVSID